LALAGAFSPHNPRNHHHHHPITSTTTLPTNDQNYYSTSMIHITYPVTTEQKQSSRHQRQMASTQPVSSQTEPRYCRNWSQSQLTSPSPPADPSDAAVIGATALLRVSPPPSRCRMLLIGVMIKPEHSKHRMVGRERRRDRETRATDERITKDQRNPVQYIALPVL
jgi:hypothetical protein